MKTIKKLNGTRQPYRVGYAEGKLVYREQFATANGGTASLTVLERKTETQIIASLPSDFPEVLFGGTIEECRAEWTACKKTLESWVG